MKKIQKCLACFKKPAKTFISKHTLNIPDILFIEGDYKLWHLFQKKQIMNLENFEITKTKKFQKPITSMIFKKNIFIAINKEIHVLDRGLDEKIILKGHEVKILKLF